MRKTLIGGCLLAVCLLMLLPSVAAEEVKVAQSAKTSNLVNVEATYLEALRKKYGDGPSPQFILITLAILFLKLVRWGILFFDAMIFLVILRIIRGHNNNTTAIC